MTAGAGRTFTYNGDNRPTQIDTQTYSYGPDGERWKTVDTSPGGGTTLYLGNDYEIAGDTVTKYLPGDAKRVSTQVAGATNPPPAGDPPPPPPDPCIANPWLPECAVPFSLSTAMAQTATTNSSGDPLVETFWLHHDHQGSLQAITDASGMEVQRFLYYPYGDRLNTATAHDQSKGWIGERQDSTGLFYLHARYYDPVIGRFVTPDWVDPMLPGVGLNRYAYSANNPINNYDPTGNFYEGYYGVFEPAVPYNTWTENRFARTLDNSGRYVANIPGSVANAAADIVLGFGEFTAPIAGIAENIAITTPFPQDDLLAAVIGAPSRAAATARSAGRAFTPSAPVHLNDIHSVNNISSRTRWGSGNRNSPKTIAYGNVDISADIAEINSGSARLLDNGDILTSSGRIYGTHSGQSGVFPRSGSPGTVDLSQAEFSILQDMIESGGLTGDARRAFEGMKNSRNPGLNAESESRLTELFNSME